MWRALSSASGLYTGREAYEDRDTSKVGKSLDKLSLCVKLEISLFDFLILFTFEEGYFDTSHHRLKLMVLLPHPPEC